MEPCILVLRRELIGAERREAGLFLLRLEDRVGVVGALNGDEKGKEDESEEEFCRGQEAQVAREAKEALQEPEHATESWRGLKSKVKTTSSSTEAGENARAVLIVT